MYVQQGSSVTTGSSGVQSLSSWTKILTVEQSQFQIRRNSYSGDEILTTIFDTAK